MTGKSNKPAVTEVTVAPAQAGWRADRALCALVPLLHRRTAKELFSRRLVRLNDVVSSGAERVTAGDRLSYRAPQAASGPEDYSFLAPRLTTPHGRHLAKLFEDDHLLVLNKPAEVPVHRGKDGLTRRDTVADVLERTYGQYYLVHRLDMETSGCLLVAKTAAAQDALIKEFATRRVEKEYLAIVSGEPDWNELTVDQALKYIRPAGKSAGRPEPFYARRRRKVPLPGQKMAAAAEPGSAEAKPAQTHFSVLARFRGYTVLHAEPLTGRTHQIRVHLALARHPLAFDPLYGRKQPLRYSDLDPRASRTEQGSEVILSRLPLHAQRLSFRHPNSGATIETTAPLPRDLKEFLRWLKKLRGKN